MKTNDFIVFNEQTKLYCDFNPHNFTFPIKKTYSSTFFYSEKNSIGVIIDVFERVGSRVLKLVTNTGVGYCNERYVKYLEVDNDVEL